MLQGGLDSLYVQMNNVKFLKALQGGSGITLLMNHNDYPNQYLVQNLCEKSSIFETKY